MPACRGVLAKPLRLNNLRRALAEAAPAEVADVDATMDWSLLDTHRSLLGEQKLQGLLKVLRQSLEQHATAFAEALPAQDFTEVLHLAHRLAGSCDSLGFLAWLHCCDALRTLPGSMTNRH